MGEQKVFNMEMNTALITGAAGFTGAALTELLIRRGIEVYALVRPGSNHNKRLDGHAGNPHIIPVQPEEYSGLYQHVDKPCDVCFHLMWTGDNGLSEQIKNIRHSIELLDALKRIGCKRFIAAGSQAEYGAVQQDDLIHENLNPKPLTAYGASKTAACYLTRQKCLELDIDWIWGRIFSLIGRYEPRGRMLPDLYWALKNKDGFQMSSGRQNWDYLDVYDAAEALIALAKRGRSGETYNIAHGAYRPLRKYTEELRRALFPDQEILYGDDPVPFISLQPSIEKIHSHTGWKPKRAFLDSVRDYERG